MEPRPPVTLIYYEPTKIGIGIDVGMTYSGASIYYKNGAMDAFMVIPCDPENTTDDAPKFESIVFERDGSATALDGRHAPLALLGDDQQEQDDLAPLIGRAAAVAASEGRPGQVFELFKRYLGVPPNEQRLAEPVDALRLTTELLTHMRLRINEYLKGRAAELGPIEPTYRFTLPGMWPREKKLALNQAIRNAGFESFGVVEEPVAMAVAASRLDIAPRLHTSRRQKFVLVCDFGGGTFDVALISTDSDLPIATKATPGGNGDLGMSNLDKAIELLIFKKLAYITAEEYDHVLGNGLIAGDKFEDLWDSARARVRRDRPWLFHLRLTCEPLKNTICEQWEADEGNRGRAYMTEWAATLPSGERITLMRAELAPLIAAMQNTAREAVQRYVNINLRTIPDLPDFDPNNISLALLGGGGALLPGIEKVLRAALPNASVVNITRLASRKRDEVRVRRHAMGMVQLGAAMVAANPRLILERRAPASFGVAVRKFVRYQQKPEMYEGYEQTLERFPNDKNGGQEEETFIAYKRFFQLNAKLPVEPVVIPVTPAEDNLSEYQALIYMGEDENPFKNQLVGKVSAPLPETARASGQIQIVCTLGDDGDLHFEGRSWDGGISKDVKWELNDD